MAKWTSRTKARRVRLATAQAWTLAATSASLALGCIAEERNVDPSPSEPGEGDPDSSSNGPEERPIPAQLTWGPTYHTSLPLEPLTQGLYTYLPHRPKAHRVKGSGHTHAAPDHSGIAPAEQERRLRDLPGVHRHGFVWLTAHSFVAPDPGVEGIVHMFAAEVYTAKYPASGVEPHVLAYLSNDDLVGVEDRPFGYFEHDLAAISRLVREAGGMLAWAHPSRHPLSDAEIDAVDDLWGMEVVSGATDVVANLAFVDRRLSAGHYVCVTGGGDVHGEGDRLTRGYQVVEVDSEPPSREEIFEGVYACNFFVCDVKDTGKMPLDDPALVVQGGELSFSTSRNAETIRFVGSDGRVLHEAFDTMTASYVPSGTDRYVRVEAFADDGRAACYSQPVWLVEAEELRAGAPSEP